MYLFMFKHSSDQYVLCFHVPFSHLAIRRRVIIHEGVDESLRKICKYQDNVPQHYYLFDTLVYSFIYCDDQSCFRSPMM